MKEYSQTHSRATITLLPKPEKDRRKKKTNITDEHRCKNPWQNIKRLNPTIHWKDHTTWSPGIYLRDARIFQYLYQSVWYTTLSKNQIEAENAFWQNSIPIYDKISPERGHRGNLPQYDKGHIWQTHS